MAYIPNAGDVTNPLDTVDRSTAAAEFRTLKNFLATFSTVASAAVPDIFTNTNRNVNYTGATPCTGFVAAASAGAERQLFCTGAAQFLAGANMLIDGTVSGSTLVVSAGAVIRVVALTTTQFQLSVLNGVNPSVPTPTYIKQFFPTF